VPLGGASNGKSGFHHATELRDSGIQTPANLMVLNRKSEMRFAIFSHGKENRRDAAADPSARRNAAGLLQWPIGAFSSNEDEV
jgi:hypothetical protein